MSLSKNELIEGYVGDRLKKVKNFELKVQTSVLLLKFFEERCFIKIELKSHKSLIC